MGLSGWAREDSRRIVARLKLMAGFLRERERSAVLGWVLEGGAQRLESRVARLPAEFALRAGGVHDRGTGSRLDPLADRWQERQPGDGAGRQLSRRRRQRHR